MGAVVSKIYLGERKREREKKGTINLHSYFSATHRTWGGFNMGGGVLRAFKACFGGV